jgi:hypothetical protein
MHSIYAETILFTLIKWSNLQKSEQTYSKKFLEIDSWNYMPGTNTGLFCFTIKVDDDL